MVCKLCPARRHCFDKGICENCGFGKAFEGLNKKAKNLKAKNEKLSAENEELKERIETLLHPNF
jgi:prefoldin subunit 5